MRLYSFVNYYLSSLQQGLQTAHIVSELFACHSDNLLLHKWAQYHKTIIILNGGNSESIWNIFQQIADSGINLPFAMFSEDRQSLNSAVTACGIIVPPSIYEFASVREFTEDNMYLYDTITTSEQTIANILKSYSLAR